MVCLGRKYHSKFLKAIFHKFYLWSIQGPEEIVVNEIFSVLGFCFIHFVFKV